MALSPLKFFRGGRTCQTLVGFRPLLSPGDLKIPWLTAIEEGSHQFLARMLGLEVTRSGATYVEIPFAASHPRHWKTMFVSAAGLLTWTVWLLVSLGMLRDGLVGSFGTSIVSAPAICMLGLHLLFAYQKHSDIRRIFMLCPQSARLHSPGSGGDDELVEFTSPAAHQIATRLRTVLDEVAYDEHNRRLRGEHYSKHPLPWFGLSEVEKSQDTRHDAMLNDLKAAGPKSPLWRTMLAFQLFMFSNTLSRDRLETLFQPDTELLEDLLEVKFLVRGQLSDRFRTNGLALISHRLSNGEIVYAFTRLESSEGRVYMGSDSITTLKGLTDPRLYFSQIGVDFGSGTGIQTIGTLKAHPDVTNIYLLDINPVAHNLSLFNASLNGVRDRVDIACNKNDLCDKLDGEKISFGVSNPPFNPMPTELHVDENAQHAAPDLLDPDNERRIDFRKHSMIPGWGGTDGLTVIKDFLLIAADLAIDGAPILLYSPVWSGVDGQPTRLQEFAETRGWKVSFDSHQDTLEAKKMAAVIMKSFTQENLQFIRFPKLFLPNYLNILEQYEELGIETFAKGMATVYLHQLNRPATS
ncbi:MAG: hypothetical protein CMJ81_04690 [Planctomycetaceae bacterium]|nr:hypothetical protein [Planctomycetaceae bacterium]MBP63681.1 hypothetical protein [Planctomycetaceae bacterium]